jgi:hypothetical protein
VVCGADTSVAASGTVATGGLFGAVLSTPVGALIVSCEGSFCADAVPTVANSVAATNSDCVFILSPVPVPYVLNFDEFARFHSQVALIAIPEDSGTFRRAAGRGPGPERIECDILPKQE